MKPWRENAIPHRDVLEGTFQQADFAADITAVRTERAPLEYRDPVKFFERTYITEGMRLLLTQVAQRLAGRGGEPVIQLQTAFGGGKTHTMLAVYHLATRKCPLSDLAGVPGLVDQAGLMDIPSARVAVLDGMEHGPAQPWKRGSRTIHTLWGELAWQLGGDDAWKRIEASDIQGTSPGKDAIRELLAGLAPCVILIDELVAYVRQFPEGKVLSGGSFDSNLSFVQALTEAVKLVPGAILLASLPESEVEAGSQRGGTALRALEKTFGRVQALWKPVATEEAFEIVRRRLFEPIRDPQVRDRICRAFSDAYVAEGARLPGETQEGRYYERMVSAYPIHPEVFDRLFEDWSSIDGFQRTRGVLRLMAKAISRLWNQDNRDLMILPSSLPLDDTSTRDELVNYLPPGWDPVIERDIDGERSETVELEKREARFGQVHAARRVARTLFLGTAPHAVATRSGTLRGLDRARVLLGCLQPGQPSSVYSDALKRLADRLHYLNSSGDKDHEATRFWFDTRANLRREMEDRKRRFDDTDVRKKIEEALQKAIGTPALFDGVHIFTSHSDVPDDSGLRLVVLHPDAWYTREEPRPAFEAILETLRSNGQRPRYRSNRLLFLAGDQGSRSRLVDAARVALAWGQIVDDIRESRLNVDLLQQKQAEKERQSAEDVMPRAARECYKWLLCPVLEAATHLKPTIEAFPLNTSGGSLASELDRVCIENELVITGWSPIHLRTRLKEFYWTGGTIVMGAMAFWEDTMRYLYLPRLRTREVLAQAIRSGATSRDFFGTAYGQKGEVFEGFRLGSDSVQLDDTLLLIEPETAATYEEAHRPVPVAAHVAIDGASPSLSSSGSAALPSQRPTVSSMAVSTAPTSFHVAADVKAATAKVQLIQIADELISLLCTDPNASVRVTVEISAEFPGGVSESIRRAALENAATLGLRNADWE